MGGLTERETMGDSEKGRLWDGDYYLVTLQMGGLSPKLYKHSNTGPTAPQWVSFDWSRHWEYLTRRPGSSR